MISTRIHVALGLAVVLALASLGAVPLFADSAKSQIVDRELQSKNFANNKIGTSPTRKMVVYLPTGYDESPKRYPVIYFLPSPFENYRLAFDQRDARPLGSSDRGWHDRPVHSRMCRYDHATREFLVRKFSCDR